ncbi:Cyanophycinase and related exopeptidases-like [Rhodoferax ferrireducens T118]|uniref:Cyanophycinase and related exopeptidases-like n=1 Tax=Albidiferax ferrireducens (strain ATCC BAA-621 / DSM 15236 / T118) TaxID=338969 RepID=Q21TC6_ALBFT|nr:cyanophycinase [Rhodoferax ferrireducens]ABD70977.1 Cyanophycinase and related exopeptidases-like [Rhodoferax ferrireducens T118]
MKTLKELRSIMGASIKTVVGLFFAAALSTAVAAGKLPYSYFFVGEPAKTPVIASSDRATTPSYVLMGGGPDVDQAFQWLIQRAGIKPGTGGRFVIIRASGTEAYNPYIYYSDANGGTSTLPPVNQDGWVGGGYLGLSSVETLVIPSVKAANDPTVNQIVARADVVFIAGGDQSDYIKYWKNTQLDWTLQALMNKKVPIGGTSAGLAVLGQFDFAALRGTVTSDQALSNPFNKYMSLDPTPQTLDPTSPTSIAGGFITPSPLFNTILDAHLDERDRMGRLVTFVSRLIGPYYESGCSGGILVPKVSQNLSATPYGDIIARGIGVGVEAALLVSGDGGPRTPIVAKLVTNPTTTTKSAAYFVLPQNYPGQCVAGQALSGVTATVVKVDKLNPAFNMSFWSGGYSPYTLTVTNGVMTVSGNGNSPY